MSSPCAAVHRCLAPPGVCSKCTRDGTPSYKSRCQCGGGSSASLVHLADVIQALPFIESCRTVDLVRMFFGDAGAHLLRLTDAVQRLIHRGGLVSRLRKGFVRCRLLRVVCHWC